MDIDRSEPDADEPEAADPAEAELWLHDLKDDLRRYVKARPFEGLLIAFLSGAVVSLLFRRSS